MRNIDIVGVQMHIGSQITEAEPFAEAIRKVAPLVRELKSKYGIKFFSIGGGMGIVYGAARERVRQMVARSRSPHARDPLSASAIMPMRLCRPCAISAFGSWSSRVGFWSATPAFCSRASVISSRPGEKKFAIVDAG